MKFENTKVFNFEGAIRGMRNPKNSWYRSDSEEFYWNGVWYHTDPKGYFGKYGVNFFIGKNDMKLAQMLIKAGSEHRKFMRQILVSVDITAPLYWWKEFDTYKVGTVANSTSTMHTLANYPITRNCFEMDDYCEDAIVSKEEIDYLIDFLETLRVKYLETKDKKYWKELIRWLPESWLQKRTVTMTYENLFAMCGKGQRRFHKLNEWSGIEKADVPNFISWARELPYAQELIFIDEEDAA